MGATLATLDPTRRLRPRITLLVVVAVGALAVLMSTQSSARLSQAYDNAGRTALGGSRPPSTTASPQATSGIRRRCSVA